jgi:decaprenylphospho-beta-D-erythro-pentofuranosid-2-ulose 2-reductase
MSLRFQRAIVVGASSGIGAEIARQLAADGAAVALLGRRAGELERVAGQIRSAGRGTATVLAHDVRDAGSIPGAFARAVEALGGLDLLVYAAGVLHLPEESEYDLATDRALMEVNVLGAMTWTGLAAARFEAARAGTLIALSSIAGERGRRTMPAYTTSKAALTAWMEALRNRLSRYGVNVVTAKPGFVDTAMSANVARRPMLVSAPRAAALVLGAARRGGSPSVFVPWTWWLVAMVLRHLPSRIFRKLDL